MKTYTITTFGCQMNLSDSERVMAICESMGFTKNPEDKIADLYIINTCSIRQKAEDRVLGMGKRFTNLKKQNPEIKVILTGCMAKRDIRQGYSKSDEFQQKYTGKLQKQMPWLDFVLEINDIYKLPELLGQKVEEKVENYFAITPTYNSNFQAFVPISTGCNKFCTFCIVPFTRGKEIYRPFDQIYEEVQNLVKKGFKEITLLGQNVNSWRDNNDLRTPITPLIQNSDSSEKDFAYLIEQLAQIEGDFWLRFTSSHPYDINLRLIDVVANQKNIAKQFHFAMQSGSNSVLKRMNRFYTSEDFKNKVLQIKEKVPNVAITTDVIVGFCGETDKEFEETLKLCEELKFDQIYISEYSQRQGTIAAKFYKDDISLETKRKRKELLDEILKKGVSENNEKLIGTTQKILIYKNKLKNKNGVFGRTTHAKDVLIKNISDSQKINLGDFVNVKITGFQKFCLEGEIL